MLIVTPGSVNRGGLQTGAGQTKSLVYEDKQAVLREIPDVTAAAGGVQMYSQVVYGTDNWFTQLIGTEPSYFDIRAWTLADGVFFSEEDAEKGVQVAVIGESLRRHLFGAIDPLGQPIRVKNLPFRVIGVLASKGGSGFGQDQDDVVIVPLATAQKKLVGNTWLNWIFLSAVSQEGSYRAQSEVAALLRDRHRIQAGAADDFSVNNMAQFSEFAEQASRLLTYLLASIASIALMVGGVGIMNIMLVSVTERTREIGIRMALGATRRDVQRQFLIEAIALSLAGGTLGIAVGELASFGVARALGWSFTIPFLAVAVAVLFSAAIGTGFGYYPARRAARLRPIEALRHE
jgi:putative ABC transport system permease protein